MAVSDPFWAAATEGRLVGQWSAATGRAVHYPRDVSPHAVGDALTWGDVEPLGTVLASTVVHRHSHPEFDAQTPFGLALVELTNGTRFLARFAADHNLGPGEPVTLAFVGSPPLLFASPAG